MTMFRKIAAALLLLTISGTAHAQSQGEVGAWSLYKNPGNCRALTTFQKVVISIAYYKNDNRTTMMVLDDTIFAGAQNRTAFDAQVVFVKNDDVDTSFANLPVQGVQLEGGTKGVYIASDGDSLLTTFGQSSIFGLIKGGDVIVSLKIEQPSDMIAALRKCAANS